MSQHPSPDATVSNAIYKFHVANLRCAGCVAKIEEHLLGQVGVTTARLSLSLGKLTVEGTPSLNGGNVMQWLQSIGYEAIPAEENDDALHEQDENRSLLFALAVAAFGAGNVMLLSLAVWTGVAGGMGPGTVTLFGWISALVALPVIAVAGKPFFRSAFKALQHRQVNMDVPIALALILTAGLSLQQLLAGEGETFFEAATTLIFFLLIGRYLDKSARTRARAAIEGLLAFQQRSATCLREDGSEVCIPAAELTKGMTVIIRPGDHIPADGLVSSGHSTLDTSPITGESLPAPVCEGSRVYAGSLNLSATLTVKVDTKQSESLAAKTRDLMETAEQRRTKYVQLANRAAAVYIPVVHGLAALTFLGWWLIGEANWQEALFIAISVLIITCPCALGLAIPTVQVVANGQLFKRGILQKSADGLERLGDLDHVIFDKTGTLTTGTFVLINKSTVDPNAMTLATALCSHSKHPLCQALRASAGDMKPITYFETVKELPGLGILAVHEGEEFRLGSRTFCEITAPNPDSHSEVFLTKAGKILARFIFKENLRPGVRQTIKDLSKLELSCSIASGDRPAAVARVAEFSGINVWKAAQLPTEKAELVREAAEQGWKTLMVGDGLNDGPALAGAYASMAPASGLDISTSHADLVFRGSSLSAVSFAIKVAQTAKKLMVQNLTLAVGYNLIAIPVAISGFASPPVAAIAMSLSSVIVTANAMRLGKLL